MNRHNKSPSRKVLPKKPVITYSRPQTPQKPEHTVRTSSHKHTFSTPVPFRSPSPIRPKIVPSKISYSSFGFNKVDLRKGIFSNKQIFLKKPLVKNTPIVVQKNIETPLQTARTNKYQVLSKEFKIDKKLLPPKKVEAKDNEGYYIPEKPPLIHEDNNI